MKICEAHYVTFISFGLPVVLNSEEQSALKVGNEEHSGK